jgi:hypothetical protein
VCRLADVLQALGIDPVSYTPEHVLTVGHVESCDGERVVVRPLRAVAFNLPAGEEAEAEAEEHTWAEIDGGDWRRVPGDCVDARHPDPVLPESVT